MTIIYRTIRLSHLSTPAALKHRRRGVSSVLAMMFLVVFSSLAAVMAVVAQGNLRTAHSNLQVNRAMSAAETGLHFAERRLLEASSRFVVEKGEVDSDFAEKLWNGTWTVGDGTVQILDASFNEDPPATSISTALANAHAADSHNLIIEPGDELLPDIDEFGKIIVRPIAVDASENPATFQLSYTPLADARYVRVTSVGTDDDITRTVQADFQIVKHIDAAIISPNRIMIGKNVHVDGPIGSRFGEDVEDLDSDNGHPLIMKSDFKYFDATLDTEIDTLIASIASFDVDNDNRLRPLHPTEQQGLTETYMVDANGDGFVDDYDLWVDFYDLNDDGQIVYSADLALAAGLGNLTEEFAGIDDQLMNLIDTGVADRNGDGTIDGGDTLLGYLDGVINNLDDYAKVKGHLLFKTSRSSWETAQGGFNYQTVVQGPIHPDTEQSSANFDVPDSKLYDLTAADFTNSQNALKLEALNGLSFDQQLTAQLGEDPATHIWSDDPTNPDYLRPDLGEWEQMPLGSPGFYDWYKRPIYKNMTFVNVKIPMGNNGLFRNCTFVGVVYVETYVDNQHQFWNYLGMKEKVGFDYLDKYDYQNWDPPVEVPPGTPIYDTKPFSNNLRFDDCTIIGSVVSDAANELTHVRNKLQFTGGSKFTLVVDEIQNSNLTGQDLQDAIEAFNAALPELQKSSLMAPNFSVDVGSFDNSGQEVELYGTIVAGVLDVRGTADITGTLLMTFKPEPGQGPLFFGGDVAAFNTTIGYFGPSDGDGEGQDLGLGAGFGEITIKYDPNIPMPDGILIPVKTKFVPGTYSEGGSL